MSQITFAVSHYAALAALALLAYHLGRAFTRTLPYASLAEEIAFSESVGLGAVAYIVMALGLLDLLYPGVVVLVLLVAGVACMPVWIQTAHRTAAALTRAGKAAAARPIRTTLASLAAAVVLTPLVILPLYPPTGFDSTMYHLAVAKRYVAEHGLVLTPDLRYPVFPQTPHMLFTLALLLFDDVVAQLTQLLALALMAVGLVACATRHQSTRAGLFAAALLLSSPLVLWLSSHAAVDTMAMLFVTLAIAAFWNWWRTRMWGWLVTAAVLGGLAMTVKLNTAFFVAVLVVVLLVTDPRRHAREAMWLAALTVLVASPWLVRNAYYTANPLFPAMRGVFGAAFGYGVFNAEDYRRLFEDFSSYGFGRSAWALLTLPWNLATNPERFAASAPLSPALFLALPLLAIGLWRQKAVRALTSLAIAYMLFWFFTGQEIRYLLPALPIVCLALGGSIVAAGAWRFGQVATLVSTAVLLVPGWVYVSRLVHAAGAIPTTQDTRDEYLSRRLPSYEAYLLLRQQGKRNYTMYGIYDENLKYYADGRQFGDYFGPARYDFILNDLADPEALRATLRSFGVDYLVVNQQRAAVPLVRDTRFSRLFSTLLDRPHVSLFDLAGSPVEMLRGEELLVNPSFEKLENGRPDGWTLAGDPVVDTAGVNSATGAVGVRCIGSTHVAFQTVSVVPRREYVLSFSARGVVHGATARRQINWHDREQQFITTSLEVLLVTDDWRRYEMRVRAPEGANYAVVYAACEGAGSAWFDDLSLTAAIAPPPDASGSRGTK